MHVCPVCGYPELEEVPRSASGGGSYEICPSCGFQFGVDDDDKGITFEAWREKWKAKGSLWSSRGIPAPKGWDAAAQLATVVKTAGAAKGNKAPAALVKKAVAAKKDAKETKPAKEAKPSKAPAARPAAKKAAKGKK